MSWASSESLKIQKSFFDRPSEIVVGMVSHTSAFQFHVFAGMIVEPPEWIFLVDHGCSYEFLASNHQCLQSQNSLSFLPIQSSYHDEPDNDKLIEKDSPVVAKNKSS